MRRVGVLVFPQVEVLDFAGPFEVFSRARMTPGLESRQTDEDAPFDVFTVAISAGELAATGGLRVVPNHNFAHAPSIDILVVPGGFGTRSLLENRTMLEWLRQTAQRAELVCSVCTGSLLLAAAGLLKGRRATTHWGAHEALAAIDPTVTVDTKARYVDDGVITSAGVAAGIDMSFYVIEKLLGKPIADETARYIEFSRNGASG